MTTYNYNTGFVCTYNFYNNAFNKFNPLSIAFTESIKKELSGMDESELVLMSEYLYNNELLYAFNVSEYDQITVNTIMTNMYEKIKVLDNDEGFMDCVRFCDSMFPDIGFTILFSYDYFHITHLCLCDLYLNGKFVKENVNILRSIILTFHS